MHAAAFDFVAERGFIAASADPGEILDWMSDYGRRRREAEAEGDDAAAARFDELQQEAEDRVVDLKAARLHPPPRVSVDAEERPRAPRPVGVATTPGRAAASVAPTAQTIRVRVADPDQVERRDSARRPPERQAAAAAAEAIQDREDQEDLRQLHERAAKARARRDAALAATARIEAAAKQAAAEAERARRDEARRRAARQAAEEERAAAEAETAARNAATTAAKAKGPSGPVVAPTPIRPRANPPAERRTVAVVAAPVAERTPLGIVHPGQSTGVAGAQPTTPTPADPSAPPPEPDAALPPLTGADLTSFRTWLAVSQRALAASLGVEQSTISKGEARPTTVLPPQLRKALHQAMGEPRDAAKAAP